jgi:hypothetical protein
MWMPEGAPAFDIERLLSGSAYDISGYFKSGAARVISVSISSNALPALTPAS